MIVSLGEGTSEEHGWVLRRWSTVNLEEEKGRGQSVGSKDDLEDLDDRRGEMVCFADGTPQHGREEKSQEYRHSSIL